LYCQKKIPEFTDMIMNLLSDHRRWTIYTN
jgi:hypothetical protein